MEHINQYIEIHIQVLVRLRVDYDGFQAFNPQRVGAALVGDIANPNEAVILSKRKVVETKARYALDKQAMENKLNDAIEVRKQNDEAIKVNLPYQ